MSAVFEGLVIPFDDVDKTHFQIGPYLKSRNTTISLDFRKLGTEVFVVFRTDPRSASFSDEVERLAVDLSAIIGRALVVRYDSRVGYRSSLYVENGTPIVGFDNDDEIYLGLNEDGTLSGEKFTYDQVVGDADYEIEQNAIQSGLEKLGCGHWDDLLDFIYDQH